MKMRGQIPFMVLVYIISIIWLVPLLWTIYMSFRSPSVPLSQGFSLDLTLDNIINVWNAAPFLTYFLNTIYIVVVIFGVQMITSTMAAYVFARLHFTGKGFIFMLYLVQIMIPVDVLIFPEYLVLRDISLLDTKLGIMIPYFASSFGIFLLRQYFKTIPLELEEAAQIEGCSKWRILWTIYFPLVRPALLSFGVVSVSYHWNNFLWPLIVTNSVENRPLTVGIALFAKSAETGAQWSMITASTLIVIVPLLLGFIIFQRKFMNSLVSSGIK